ncbi:MAG: hypothetical protein JZU65_19525 [Chlorobium sp.]|jgi:uncharacterized protein (TIGR02145 family)|nr:hypothetical protein [Chlorobium sp.]
MKHIVILAFILLILGCSKNEDLEKATSQNNNASDADGNTYKTVVIGTQTWFAENLKTTKYKDGTAIPLVTDNTAWKNLTTPAYCWYNNTVSNKATYGALYNWHTVSTANLCPAGWHVPSDSEWKTLTDFLKGESTAGNKLKEAGTTHWNSPNTGATNESGFTALPGGYRDGYNGSFLNMGIVGVFLTPTITIINTIAIRGGSYDSTVFGKGDCFNKDGLSVRCIKD